MATMSETETFDVVIAGGGMVGTTLARLLSDLDSKGNPLRVALLDRLRALRRLALRRATPP